MEQALSTYLEALEHSPENPDILTTLGLTFLRCAARVLLGKASQRTIKDDAP
jgi:hypothetical protein